MRPQILKMQAFGPYANVETIDFRKLSGEQIFVISGKTGSGKTTIFDAINFALYGKANTDDRDARSLRSHFAPIELLTEVTFDFSVKDRLFRIVRTPAQQILKRNSSETREISATAHLYEYGVDGAEVLLGQSISEVNQKIADVIQLTSDQFSQILMLPQGEFRKLLVAPSLEKQAILQKLAQTNIYKDIENRLKEKQSEMLDKIENIRANTFQYVLQIFPDLDEEISAIDAKVLFTERQETMKKELRESEEDKSILQRKIDNVQKDFNAAEALAKEWRDLENLEKKVEQFTKDAVNMEKTKLTIKRAKDAALLEVEYALLDQVQNELTAQQKLVVETSKEKEAINERYDVALKEKQSIHADIADHEQRKAHHVRLIDWEAKIKKLTSDHEALKKAEIEHEAFIKEKESLASQKTQLLKSKDGFLESEENIRKAKLELKENELLIETNSKHLKEFQTDKNYLEQKAIINQKLQELQKDIGVLNDHEGTLKLSVEELTEKQKSYQADVLAKELIEGLPCPVCGSTTHPGRPHSDAEELDSRLLAETIEQLEIVGEELTDKKLEAERLLGQLEQIPTTVHLLNKLTEEIDAATIFERKALEEQGHLGKIILEEMNVMDKLAWINKELTTLETSTLTNQNAIADIRAELSKYTASIELHTREIPLEYRDLAAYYEQLKLIEQQIFDFEQKQTRVLEAFEIEQKAQQNIETKFNEYTVKEVTLKADANSKQEKFENSLIDHGFQNFEEYEKAKLPSDQITLQETEVRTFEQEVYHTTQTYEELERKLSGREEPDLSIVQEQLNALKSEHEMVLTKMAEIHAHEEQIKKVKTSYEESLLKLAQWEKAYQELGELADSARGRNDRRIGLERYVLGAFLDLILERANEKLLEMTNGRFYLERKLDAASHNAQSGLDLVVHDEYTDSKRDVTTLSGGETFKASLALALALAQVVQEQAGGISLETMFIDEGFGTLDPDSLDLAVETLMETQSSGRLVGIISHVPELKSRVNAILEVTMTNSGSAVELKMGDALQYE